VCVCVCSTHDNEICSDLVLPRVPFCRRDVSMDGDPELVDQYMPTVSVSICCPITQKLLLGSCVLNERVRSEASLQVDSAQMCASSRVFSFTQLA